MNWPSFVFSWTFLTAAGMLYAAPGELDPSFGVAGQVTTAFAGSAGANGVAMQSDGKVLAAGYSHNGGNNDFCVVRYNADGTLDTSFGSGGKVTTDFGGSEDEANGITVQADGKIIAVGRALTGGVSPGFALARYHPDGTLDASFGPAGTGRIVTVIGVGHAETQARSVRLQPDGKILVAGHARPTGASVIDGQDFALLRYHSDGTLDNGFGASGLVTAVYSYDEFAFDLAVQQDGKILLAGNAGGFFSGALVVRYLSDGTPDTGFGDAGKVFFDHTTHQMLQCHAVALQADGRIVVAGGTIGGDFCLRRCNADGTVDTTFGSNGVVVTPIGTAAEVSFSLALQDDGRMVAAGRSFNANSGFDDFALVRYNENGSLDTTFGGTGRVTTSFSSGSAVSRGMVIGLNGRIVVVGHEHDGTKNNFALARYLAVGSLVLTTPAHLSQTNTAQPLITGKASPGSTVNVYVDGSLSGAAIADGSGAWSYTVGPPLVDGVHSVAVVETDGFGNTGPFSATVSFTVDTVAPAAPVIAAPSEGALVNSGWPVISGSAEAGAMVVVHIDGTEAGSTIASNSGAWSFIREVALADGAHTVKAAAADRAGNTGVFSTMVGFSTAAALFGGPGERDSSFGASGQLTTSIGIVDDRGHAVVLQGDGKVLAAGYSHNGSNRDFALMRYNANGTLDTSFGSGGKVVTDFGGSEDEANGITVQADGKIIAVGRALTGGASPGFALARYHPDGALDTSFGPAGTGRIVTVIGVGHAETQARSVRLQPDGKILVAGHARPTGTSVIDGQDFALLRYNSDGTLDNGFGAGGLVTTTNQGNIDYGFKIQMQPDGKILLGGWSGGHVGTGLMATRYHDNGAPDATFGSAGLLYVDGNNGGMLHCLDMLLQADGKIIFAGVLGVNGARDFCLRRHHADGTVDVSFGSNGLVGAPVGTGDDAVFAAALQNDGKIVAVGHAFDANTNFNSMALVRYNSDGSLDAIFRGTGRVITGFPGGNAAARGVVIGPDGRIVVAGHAHDGTKDNFALARFFGTNQPPRVTTGDATGVVRSGAVLNGIVNPNNLATTARFEYGLTTAYGSMTPDLNLGNGHLDLPATVVIGGLTDNTLYHYRLVATNAAGTTYGADAVFTTAPNPPLAFTGDAANVSASGATLVGTVLPNGRDTTAYFEYGLTTVYGAQTNSQLVPAAGTIENVLAPLTGLVAGATYHFRLVAINAGSPIPITGVDKTFVAQAPPPVVTLGAAGPLTTTSVSLSGTVNANGASTQVFFDYGTDGVSFPFSVAASPSAVTGSTSTAVSGSFASLSQAVTYHYRLRAVSAGGTTTSSVATFTLDLLSGLVQTFPGAPPEADGFLIVNLMPPGILSGWRFVGEQQWRASGVAAGGLTTGNRDIEFRPVPGYNHPPLETVEVISGQAATVLTLDYYDAFAPGNGALTVTLKPDSITTGPERAQWRFLGEDDSRWRDSGETEGGLVAGSHLIECKAVAGRSTPPNANVVITPGNTTLATLTYFLADAPAGTPPGVLAFESVTGDTTRPYAFAGQLRSDAGVGTGFVVKPRVVATAAHVLWNDGTLSAAQGMQWLFQRHRGLHEPLPQEPRGFYLFSSYSGQRAAEATPGFFSPQSQHLDVAALYFTENAGRGGHGGFLASDLEENEFLLSNANKMLVGYPVDGIALTSQGRMHATPPMNVVFDKAFGRTFTTTGIRSSGGNSGGPLCVQFEGGAYYPAAICLGGSGQMVVRAIDSAVLDLFGYAEISGAGGGGIVGGGASHTTVTPIDAGGKGSIRVLIESAEARNAGAWWKLSPSSTARPSGFQINNLTPGGYVANLATLAGYQAPAAQHIPITANTLTTITYTYQTAMSAQESWRHTYFGTTANSGDAADNHDYDRDGFTNAEEYAAGTNPVQRGDFFRANNPQRGPGTFSVSTAGKAGRSYILERSVTMAAGTWSTVDTEGPLAADGPVTLTDAASPSGAAFYRIRVTGP